MLLEKLKRVLREKSKSINVIYISSYIPRRCGIATYTSDLTKAINLIDPYSKAEIMALIRPEDKINYPLDLKSAKFNNYEQNPLNTF
ncbi:hypothetical protein HKBW3S44_01945, partial [Candidatus Hakubella thermalkaliphila]